MVYDTSTTTLRPSTEIRAIDLSAGCSAKINTPMPTIAVKAEKNIAVLCAPNTLLPLLYSSSRPSMMKMLKSSPIPKIKVARMIFTMLNLMPKSAIMPRMRTQLIAIGRKVSSVSSMRPYDTKSAKKTISDETSRM